MTSLSIRLPKKVDRDIVKRLIKDGHLLDAAQVIVDEASTPDLHQDLRELFKFKIDDHHQIFEDLAAIDPRITVTTNYDELLEKGLEHYNSSDAYNTFQHTEKHALNYVRSPMRCIMKFHGTILDLPNLVLSRTSYYSARKENPGFYALMSALMTVHTVVFFGYGLADPDIQLILENISIQNSSDHPHYVISQKMPSTSLRRAYETTYNLKVIEYPSSDHSRMALLLRELRDAVDATRQKLGII